MLLYIILFIVLQPNILTKKIGLINISDILLRSFVFIIIIFVFKQYEEGFQISEGPLRKGIQISGDAESLQLVGTRVNLLYEKVIKYISNVVNYTATSGLPHFFNNIPTYNV